MNPATQSARTRHPGYGTIDDEPVLSESRRCCRAWINHHHRGLESIVGQALQMSRRIVDVLQLGSKVRVSSCFRKACELNQIERMLSNMAGL